MSPTEIGVVFAYLLRWREISGNPPGRSLRDGEREAARILANCNSSDLDDFEGFLNAQGFLSSTGMASSSGYLRRRDLPIQFGC